MVTSGLKSILYLIPFALLLGTVSVFAQRPWTTQIASAITQSEAETKVSELKARGLDAYWIKSNVPGTGVRYRVRIGRFASRAAAQANGEKLRQQGIASDYFVAEYEAPPRPAKPKPTPTVKVEPPVNVAEAPARPREVVTPKPTPTPATINQTVKTAPPIAKPTPAVVRNSTNNTTNASGNTLKMPAAPKLMNPGFQLFNDTNIGYSFEHPTYWSGAAWSDAERLSQNVDGGASFKSREDAAFLNVIWNKLPSANDPNKYDNTLLVDTIVKSMGSGADTQNLNELSRRVEQEGNHIKTFVDLSALFRDPGTSASLNFLGKAVVTRTQRGILLVVVFYSQDAPTVAGTNAERIVRSVRAPD